MNDTERAAVDRTIEAITRLLAHGAGPTNLNECCSALEDLERAAGASSIHVRKLRNTLRGQLGLNHASSEGSAHD